MGRLEGTCRGAGLSPRLRDKGSCGDGEQSAAPGRCAEEARGRRVTFRDSEPWEGTRADQAAGHGGQIGEPAQGP